MTFEKQFCEKCGKLRFCVDSQSLSIKAKINPKWLCEYCFGWIFEEAHYKDTIRSIMIQCGIEDLEIQDD